MFIRLCERVRSVGNFFRSPLLLLIRLYWGYQFVLTGWGKFLYLDKTAAFFQSLDIPFPYVNGVLSVQKPLSDFNEAQRTSLDFISIKQAGA